MDCKNCGLTSICHVAYLIQKNALTMTIVVTDCQYKKPNHQVCEEPKIVTGTDPLTEISERAFKTYKDFNEISKTLNPEVDIKILDDNPVPNLELVQCPSCGGTTYKDDIRSCSKKNCINFACSNCGTQTEKGFFCEKCWKTE